MAESIVTEIDFLSENIPECAPVDVATAHVVTELTAYFHNPQMRFTIPWRAGTPFQQRVWAALCAIPVGTTCTYGALAKQLGTAARAIGGACRANPLPIIIPCHRVVGQNGLVGYTGAVTGDPLAIKRALLAHEALG